MEGLGQGLVHSKSSINETGGNGLFFKTSEILASCNSLGSRDPLPPAATGSCLESASGGQKSYSVSG